MKMEIDNVKVVIVGCILDLDVVFEEIDNDLGFGMNLKHTNNLSHWRKQGVLLLDNLATEDTFEQLKKHKHIVYMLWGDEAQDKQKFIDTSCNLILTGATPSASRDGFLGGCYFSQANSYLMTYLKEPIQWSLV